MQRVTFTSARGEMVELYHDPFFLNKIEGLGDVQSETQTQRAPQQDGSTPVFTNLEERYIPIEVVILRNLLDNRQLLSRVFNPKLGPGVLTYDNGQVIRRIGAQSEHVPIFPDERPRKVQKAIIDLVCHDPYFRDMEDKKTDIALWEPRFHFPLVIPQDTGIKMGVRTESLIVNVKNEGHTDTGMIIQLKASSEVRNPQLVNVNTLQFIKLNYTMSAGEVITINTNQGAKTIISDLNGIQTNIFNTIEFGSKFMQLLIGDNLFRYQADFNENSLSVTIYHSNKYVGV